MAIFVKKLSTFKELIVAIFILGWSTLLAARARSSLCLMIWPRPLFICKTSLKKERLYWEYLFISIGNTSIDCPNFRIIVAGFHPVASGSKFQIWWSHPLDKNLSNWKIDFFIHLVKILRPDATPSYRPWILCHGHESCSTTWPYVDRLPSWLELFSRTSSSRSRFAWSSFGLFGSL